MKRNENQLPDSRRKMLIEAIANNNIESLHTLTNPDKQVIVIGSFYDMLRNTNTIGRDESKVVYTYTEDFKMAWNDIEKNITETREKNQLIRNTQNSLL